MVGGATRDNLMGLPMNDFDLATSAYPDEVKKLFRKVIPTGIKHGTVTVHYKNHEFEITTFRVESEYANRRHPDNVTFTRSITEDLKRRDFTVNAIALNLATSELIDPHKGQEDIKKKIIRAIGNPADRFNEDGLRLLRAVRFTVQLDFSLEKETRDALNTCGGNLSHVSQERIRDEFTKILQSEKPSKAFLLMEETGILPIFLPELSRCRGISQKGFHDFDVFDHSIYSCDGAPRESLVLRLAALLHDLGKPESLAFDEMKIPTFHNHEILSEKAAHAVLQRLKYSKAVEESVCLLIRHHMFHYEDVWTDGAVRRFLSRVSPERIDDLFLLRLADQYGMTQNQTDPSHLKNFKRRIDRIIEEDHALTIRDLKIDGNILNSQAGVPRGPLMGVILNFLLESVLEDPALNDREKLLEIALNFYRTRLKNSSEN